MARGVVASPLPKINNGVARAPNKWFQFAHPTPPAAARLNQALAASVHHSFALIIFSAVIDFLVLEILVSSQISSGILVLRQHEHRAHWFPAICSVGVNLNISVPCCFQVLRNLVLCNNQQLSLSQHFGSVTLA